MKKIIKTACHLGLDDAFGRLVAQELTKAGYEMVALDAGLFCDFFVDSRSRTATDLRAAVSALHGRIGHYALVSSFRVYPTVPRHRPWTEAEIDVVMDLSIALAPATLAARALERELRLLARTGFAFTILRPSLIEGRPSDDIDLTCWLADRILNGGVVVLPDGDLPSYRHLSKLDLARAIAAVAGKEATHGQSLNVTNQANLSYWGHAAMVRDGLDAPLCYGYVPQTSWRSACLTLPLDELGSSAFIEASPLLETLGWHAEDPFVLVKSSAIECAHRKGHCDMGVIERERDALAQAQARVLYQPGKSSAPLPAHETLQWLLRGWGGHPASLSLERVAQVQQFPTPVVKVRALTLLAAEERFLRGEYPQQGDRALGHNALLEVINAGPHPLANGSMAIAMAMLPCGVAGCTFCAGGMHTVLGIGCSGFGLGICSLVPSHLVPVPPALGMAALLADPLASLMAGISERLAQDSGPVWVAGRTYEAALVAWLAQDVGRPVVHVDRRDWEHPEFPVKAVEHLLAQRRSGAIDAPTLALDFTGSADVSWAVANALAEGGHLFVRRRPPGIPAGIHWHELSAAAPNRAVLEAALERLQRWKLMRNLDRYLGPAIPLDLFWDVLLPAPFSLPYLEAK